LDFQWAILKPIKAKLLLAVIRVNEQGKYSGIMSTGTMQFRANIKLIFQILTKNYRIYYD